MSSNRPKVIGAGLQTMNTNRRKQPKVRRQQTSMPGKTLSLRATAQVFYKYNNEDGEEEAVSPQYDFDRLTCNSKSMSASWAETIELVCETNRRHHLSIVVRCDDDKMGRLFEVELHAHKFVKDNADGSIIFRESKKYKTPEENRVPEISARWYSGILGMTVQAKGNVTGKGAVPELSDSGGGSSTKVAPTGDPSAPLILSFTLKSLMQAPQAASDDPAEMKAAKKKAAAQRRQVCFALLTILM